MYLYPISKVLSPYSEYNLICWLVSKVNLASLWSRWFMTLSAPLQTNMTLPSLVLTITDIRLRSLVNSTMWSSLYLSVWFVFNTSISILSYSSFSENMYPKCLIALTKASSSELDALYTLHFYPWTSFSSEITLWQIQRHSINFSIYSFLFGSSKCYHKDGS